MVLGDNAYDSSCYGYELFTWFLDQILDWSLYCSWHIYGLMARYMDDYSELHCWRHDDVTLPI